MNERIRQFERESGLEIYGLGARREKWEHCMEKFTELIVRECANHCDLLLDHKISSEWSRGTHDCSRAIKKHFGVEE
jgi:hypothetical protein